MKNSPLIDVENQKRIKMNPKCLCRRITQSPKIKRIPNSYKW